MNIHGQLVGSNMAIYKIYVEFGYIEVYQNKEYWIPGQALGFETYIQMQNADDALRVVQWQFGGPKKCRVECVEVLDKLVD